MAGRLFAELVRPRDAMLHFDDRRLMLAADPKAALTQLFDHYVHRGFVTKAYQERRLEDSVRRLLFSFEQADALRFQPGKVVAGNFTVNFPFVRRAGDDITRVIKPLYLGYDDPTRLLTHGGQWVDRVNRLRRRNALPKSVLFPVAAPMEQEPACCVETWVRQGVDP